MTHKTQLLLPAAGMGERLGHAEPKALVPIGGVPLIVRTLAVFAGAGLADGAVILAPPDWEDRFQTCLADAFDGIRMIVATGGAERQDSVRRGLDALDSDTELVMIHDGARPFVSIESVESAIDAANAIGGATVATPCIDTVLEASAEGELERTPDRSSLWLCQTPQVFRVDSFRASHAKAWTESLSFTDDATLFAHYGGRVKIVAGTPDNRKVTTPADLRFAEFVTEARGD